MYPQWPANPEEWFGITKDAMKRQNCMIQTRPQWLNAYHIHVFRFNHPYSEEQRILSGLDTRSMNVSGVYQSTGISAPGDTPLTIIAQMTNTLRIGRGLAINLIV